VTATANQPGFGRSCPCTKTRARYSVGKICKYVYDVLCARHWATYEAGEEESEVMRELGDLTKLEKKRVK